MYVIYSSQNINTMQLLYVTETPTINNQCSQPAISRFPGILWALKDFIEDFIENNKAFHTRLDNMNSATMPTSEDGGVRPKHDVKEYTQDKHKNKNVAFRTVITLIYRRLIVMQEDAEI
jgi:hypothetical protein